MRLDKSVVQKIIETIDGVMGGVAYLTLREKLKALDLVFKSGDSSQSVLVESKRKYKCSQCKDTGLMGERESCMYCDAF